MADQLVNIEYGAATPAAANSRTTGSRRRSQVVLDVIPHASRRTCQ